MSQTKPVGGFQAKVCGATVEQALRDKECVIAGALIFSFVSSDVALGDRSGWWRIDPSGTS